jgi:hypothetical protein
MIEAKNVQFLDMRIKFYQIEKNRTIFIFSKKHGMSRKKNRKPKQKSQKPKQKRIEICLDFRVFWFGFPGFLLGFWVDNPNKNYFCLDCPKISLFDDNESKFYSNYGQKEGQ